MSVKKGCFSTIKVVGISGVGKTTVINGVIKQLPEIRHICFSEYLKKYGHLAETHMMAFLRKCDGLVLMDEHMEIGEDDLSGTYKEENTIGIFVIEATSQDILKRRKSDQTRVRCDDIEKIVIEQNNARKRAVTLSVSNVIPILFTKSGSVDENIELLNLFINLLRQK